MKAESPHPRLFTVPTSGKKPSLQHVRFSQIHSVIGGGRDKWKEGAGGNQVLAVWSESAFNRVQRPEQCVWVRHSAGVDRDRIRRLLHSPGELFAAEGIHSKQKVLLISSLSETDIHEWCAKLPCLRETQQSAMESKGDVQQRMPMERAWQYSQYLSQTGSTIVSSCLKRRKERSHGVLPRV